jgi:hypothetical protein
MRFTVHAEQRPGYVEFQFATAIEAISKTWQLLEAGAARLRSGRHGSCFNPDGCLSPPGTVRWPSTDPSPTLPGAGITIGPL